MNIKLTILFSIFVIIIIILINRNKLLNNFNENYGYYCGNCGRNKWKGERACSSCVNCGWCIDYNGNGSCGIGGVNGPLFKECRSWFYRGIKMYGPDYNNLGPIFIEEPPRKVYWWSPWHNSSWRNPWYSTNYINRRLLRKNRRYGRLRNRMLKNRMLKKRKRHLKKKKKK